MRSCARSRCSSPPSAAGTLRRWTCFVMTCSQSTSRARSALSASTWSGPHIPDRASATADRNGTARYGRRRLCVPSVPHARWAVVAIARTTGGTDPTQGASVDRSSPAPRWGGWHCVRGDTSTRGRELRLATSAFGTIVTRHDPRPRPAYRPALRTRVPVRRRGWASATTHSSCGVTMGCAARGCSTSHSSRRALWPTARGRAAACRRWPGQPSLPAPWPARPPDLLSSGPPG